MTAKTLYIKNSELQLWSKFGSQKEYPFISNTEEEKTED